MIKQLPSIKLTAIVISLVSAPVLTAQKVATEKSQITIPFKFSASGHQYVKVKYKGKTLNFIIDSGAGANALSKNAVQKLKLKTQKSNAKVAGTGHNQQQLFKVNPFKLSISGTEVEAEGWIALDLAHLENAVGVKPLDGLLGAPFMKEHKAKLDFGDNTITINLDK